MQQKDTDLISEFEEVIDNLYGLYLDSTTGLVKLVEILNNVRETMIQKLEKSDPKIANTEYLDNQLFIYGEGNPNTPEALKLYECTQDEFYKRNSENGRNHIYMGNLTLISIYHYWESFYRGKIAEFKKIRKEDLQLSIMGDLGKLHRSIVHHRGIALKDVEKCKFLNWFKEGNVIYFNKEYLKVIVSKLKDDLRNLKN